MNISGNANAHYVVIGNGPAGNAAASALREGAPEARVTIISDEPQHFYQRCKLPEFATGAVALSELMLGTTAWYRERRIDLRLGQKVVGFDDVGRTLLLAHKERVSFDGCIIATGGRPRTPPRLASCKDHILTLKTLFDAMEWQKRLSAAETVLLLGGDLVSIRFAHSLVKAGKQVRLCTWDEAFWPLRLDEDKARRIREALGRNGVEVLCDAEFNKCAPAGARLDCGFSNGSSAEFDIVGGFFGYEPEVSVFGNSRLKLDRGILVDEQLATRAAKIFVAGDAAQVYNPELNNYWTSIGWANAEVLGALAAKNLLGSHEAAKGGVKSYLDVEGVRVNTEWWTEPEG